MAKIHLRHIDGLRGIAILLVLLFHLWIFSGNPQAVRGSEVWWNPIAGGYVGVHLFLVISGFCICWPYVNGQEMRIPAFAARRALRLLPPYFVSLAGYSFIALAFHYRHWYWPESPDTTLPALAKVFVTHVLLVHNLFPNHILAVNGPFWSLALEAQLYLTVPLLLLLAKKYSPWAALGVALFTTLIFRVAAVRWAHGLSGMESLGMKAYTIMHSLPARWLEFALGLAAAHLLKRGTRWLPWYVAVLAAGGLLAAAAWLVRTDGEYHPLVDPLFGVGFFLLLLAGGMGAGHPWQKILHWSPLVKLGEISFSVYLVHQPLIRLLCLWLKPLAEDPMRRFGLDLLLAMPVCLVLSILFFLLVESPSHRLAKRLITRSRVIPPASMPLAEPTLPFAAHEAPPERGAA